MKPVQKYLQKLLHVIPLKTRCFCAAVAEALCSEPSVAAAVTTTTGIGTWRRSSSIFALSKGRGSLLLVVVAIVWAALGSVFCGSLILEAADFTMSMSSVMALLTLDVAGTLKLFAAKGLHQAWLCSHGVKAGTPAETDSEVDEGLEACDGEIEGAAAAVTRLLT